MVGDNANGDIRLCVLTVLDACNRAYCIEDLSDGVYLEEVVNVLHYASKTLKTHTCIDVLCSKLRIVALAVIVELREYVVPDLDKSVALAAGVAVGVTTCVLLATVEIDLGAGTAGTASVLPEVILLAHTNDALSGNADLLVPDLERLIVLLVDGGIETVSGDLESLCEELPAPLDSLVLEVIAEGEVTEHFEERTVTCSFTYVVNVTCSDTLLASADTVTGGLFLTGKELLHRSHTGVDEEEGFIVYGDKREAVKSQMLFGFKEGEISFAKIIKRCPLHSYNSL